MSYNLSQEELNEMRNWYPQAEQLVRLGMLPVNQLPHIKRALVAIENDAYLPLLLRKPFYRFMDEVMELALGEPGIYRLIRNKVAANRNNSVINRYMPEETTMDHEEELNEEELSELSVELMARATDKSAKRTKNLVRKYKDEWKKGKPVSQTGEKIDKSQKQNHKFHAAYKEKLTATHTRRPDGIWVKKVQEERDADERAGDKEDRQFKHKYNKDAVDKAIASSRQKIGKKEGSAIHRLLKGRHESVEHESVELVEGGNAENKAKKREFDKSLATNVAAKRGYFAKALSSGQGGFKNLVQAGRMVRKGVRSSSMGKIAKGEEWIDRLKEETVLEGNAENKAKKNAHATKLGHNIASNDGQASYGSETKTTGRKELRTGSTKFSRSVREGLFDAIRAKDIKLADIGKGRKEIPKPVPGRVKMGTRDGTTPRYTMAQDGTIKRQTNEELELLALNLLDEDVDYRKTPQGMLQTLSSMVKIKKRHGGKVSVNDRKIASKARNELRRRKYFSAGQTLAASFDTAYLDLADMLAEENIFLTDEQLDALETELTEEALMEISPELKLGWAKKVESNLKEKGLVARGTKKFDKAMKRLKTASAILKTESVEALDEISNAMKKRYIKKVEQEQGDAAQDYHKARAGSPAQDDAEDRMYKRDDKIARARKTMKAESVEVVQELTKKTLVPYVKKAVNSKSDADFSLGMHTDKQNQNQHYRAVGDKGSYLSSVNQLLRKSEKRNKGISMAVDKLAKESYAADVTGVNPKMKVKFSKEAFDKKFNKTLELFEVKHLSELDADMTKLFLSLVQSEGKSDEDYQERVYDKIRAAKKDDSKLSPEQIRYRAEKQARAAKTQAALDSAKEELPKTKIGSGWSKVKSDVE